MAVPILNSKQKKGELTIAHGRAAEGTDRAHLSDLCTFWATWRHSHAIVRHGHAWYFCTWSSYFCLQSAPNHAL